VINYPDRDAQEAIDIRDNHLQIIKEYNQLKQNISKLRQLVYMEDIPSSNCPEYQEHHQSILRILKFIDNELE
jgi:hypothetical protein